jgi:tripartite-type tricarboxylate transporter receptor subunit TctC
VIKRLLLLLALFLPASTHLPGSAHAAAWPERPITLVVPFAAGGITDLLARLTAERLTNTFGKPFVVENVVGAAGTLATERVARAKPDGYTLLFATITQITVAPFLNKITYDPIADFKPVAIVATSPFVISVSANFPANNLAEFVAHVKKHQGKLTYGTAGAGSLSHLSSAVFLKRAGLDMVMVPYKGVAPAFNDLLGGNVHMVSATPVELKPFIGTDKLKYLGTSGANRSTVMPDVPAIAETYPGHDIETWNGVVAPSGTPADIIDALAREITAAENDPKFVERLKTLGVDPIRVAKDEFAALIARNMEEWRKRVADMGLQAQ